MAGQNLYEKNNNRFKTIILSYVQSPERFFVTFFVIGLIALGLGVWYSRNTIRKPFLIVIDEVKEKNNNEALDNFAELLAEQQKDTDGDGLTDYQETNIYQTSIYLKDSDSDGLDDNIEIARGSNPNCPEGQDCSFVPTPSTDISADDLVANDKTFLSPEYIASAKLILLQNGYTEDELNNMSDEQAVQLYEGLLDDPDSSINKQREFVSGTVSVDNLRQILLDNGANPELLDQISDDDLLNVYNATLQQQLQ